MDQCMQIYNDEKHMIKLCNKAIRTAYFLLAVFILIFILLFTFLITSNEEIISYKDVCIVAAYFIGLSLMFLMLFKYYAYDIILSIELKGDVIYLCSKYRKYNFVKGELISLRLSFSGENMAIIFKNNKGKKVKKIFKKYIINGIKKTENLNIPLLNDLLIRST